MRDYSSTEKYWNDHGSHGFSGESPGAGKHNWQPAGSPPTWLTHILLFYKSDPWLEMMGNGRRRANNLQSTAPSPRPGHEHDFLMALVWAWLKCPHLWRPLPPSLATSSPLLIPTAFIWVFSWFLTSGYSVIIEAGIRSLPYNQSRPLIMGLSKLIQCRRENISFWGLVYTFISPDFFLLPS